MESFLLKHLIVELQRLTESKSDFRGPSLNFIPALARLLMRWMSAAAWLHASDDSPADEELIRAGMFGLVERSHLVRAPRPLCHFKLILMSFIRSPFSLKIVRLGF